MIDSNKLLKAVLRGKVSEVEKILKFEGEKQAFDILGNGRTYLHLSVYLNCTELVKLFLRLGISVNSIDGSHATPLHQACKVGSEYIVELLIDHGADCNARSQSMITPLHVAAASGNLSCIKAMLNKASHELDTECLDVCGQRPIHHAVYHGRVAVTAFLIKEMKCKLDAQNLDFYRPQHFAAYLGNPDLLELILDNINRADIDDTTVDELTALHIATRQARPEIVIMLLKANADPNMRDSSGNTCAHLAIKGGHIDLINIFMDDPRTDSSLTDGDRNTVIHLALKLGHFNLIPKMLPRARNLATPDDLGCSVLIEAIKNQLEELSIEMLKACPSLVHVPTHELVTPLHLAAERGMKSLTEELLIAGAKVDAADANGLTPSLYCAKNDSVLECLSMIEEIMMINDNHNLSNDGQRQQVKGNNSKVSSRISA